MNSQLPKTIYLVNEVAGESLDEQGMPVRSFTSRAEAEACCEDFEREKRAEVNPFEHGATLEELTCLDADRFHDWILDVGLEPPSADNELNPEDWICWWNERCPTMTELQRAKMWQALAKVRFYRVVELHATDGW
jgi:hypothetical protein